MASNLDRRDYDVLRLIERHEPVGSINLVRLMERHGHSIQDRTIRVILGELDEQGLTQKVSGRGRQLTEKGRGELRRGGIRSRAEMIRARIEMLKNKATYDPADGTGEVVAGFARIDPGHLPNALDVLERLHESKLGPCPVAWTETDGHYQLSFPSSITIDSVFLSRGISSRLETAGLVDYHPDPDPESVPHTGDVAPNAGGAVLRYLDTINGEGSTMDVVRILVESGRTESLAAINGQGTVIVDNREVPINRASEITELAPLTRSDIGGVLDVRRPREAGPFPSSRPGWDFLSLTYGGIAEIAISTLVEADLTNEWETLDTVVPRSEFTPAPTVREQLD